MGESLIRDVSHSPNWQIPNEIPTPPMMPYWLNLTSHVAVKKSRETSGTSSIIPASCRCNASRQQLGCNVVAGQAPHLSTPVTIVTSSVRPACKVSQRACALLRTGSDFRAKSLRPSDGGAAGQVYVCFEALVICYITWSISIIFHRTSPYFDRRCNIRTVSRNHSKRTCRHGFCLFHWLETSPRTFPALRWISQRGA